MLPHSYLPCLLTIFALYVTKTYPTPVHNHLEANSPLCPTSWFQYGKFCVTHAPPGSERAVALYCDGLGGIGVSGLCVIKARDELLSVGASGLELSPGLSPLLPSGGDLPLATADAISEMEDGEQAVAEESKSLCPRGWYHFRSMCVYRSDYSEDHCYKMDAIHFRGMCLKHAEQRDATQLTSETDFNRQRRICCCAHPSANHNGYGC